MVMAESSSDASDDEAVTATQPVRQDKDDAEMVDGTQPVRQRRVADRRPRLAAMNAGVEDICLADVDETSIGRAPKNTAQLFDSARDAMAQMVSGSHAIILRQGDDYVLSDAVSTHGTTVNGRAIGIDENVLLRDGDAIVFGMGRSGAEETYTIFTFTVHDVSPPREDVYRKNVLDAVEEGLNALRASGVNQTAFLGHAGALVRSLHAAEAKLNNVHARANQNVQQRQSRAQTTTAIGRRRRNESTAGRGAGGDGGRGHGGGGGGNGHGRGGGSGRGGGGSGRGGGGSRERGGNRRGRGAGFTLTGHVAPNSGINKGARGQGRGRP
jgi:pSer/pThr/pTyr-binding forkhead associated (FHA) protein